MDICFTGVMPILNAHQLKSSFRHVSIVGKVNEGDVMQDYGKSFEGIALIGNNEQNGFYQAYVKGFQSTDPNGKDNISLIMLSERSLPSVEGVVTTHDINGNLVDRKDAPTFYNNIEIQEQGAKGRQLGSNDGYTRKIGDKGICCIHDHTAIDGVYGADVFNSELDEIIKKHPDIDLKNLDELISSVRDGLSKENVEHLDNYNKNEIAIRIEPNKVSKSISKINYSDLLAKFGFTKEEIEKATKEKLPSLMQTKGYIADRENIGKDKEAINSLNKKYAIAQCMAMTSQLDTVAEPGNSTDDGAYFVAGKYHDHKAFHEMVKYNRESADIVMKTYKEMDKENQNGKRPDGLWNMLRASNLVSDHVRQVDKCEIKDRL